MPYLRYAYVIAGAAILALIGLTTDLAGGWALATRIGWGFAVVLGLYLVDFMAVSLGWHVAFPSLPPTRVWAYRLWKARMVGEAFNLATPLAMMGGEPVKAVILKRRHGIGYLDTIASLVVARTTVVIALVVFLASGLALMFASPAVSPAFRASAGIGLGIFTAAILAFFLVQRLKLLSRAGRLFKGPGAGGFLHQIHLAEDRLIEFYSRRRGRFAGALALALLHWLLGVVSLYYIFQFLGHPLSFGDAWIIEAFTQLVLATTFFIPGNIGTQEGAFVVIISALTGNPTLGLSVALIRRGRDILWVAWGLALGWRYLGKRAEMDRALSEFRAGHGQ